jgi:hypothetical protein
MHLPALNTPQGAFDLLLAFIFFAMLSLSAMFVIFGLVQF